VPIVALLTALDVVNILAPTLQNIESNAVVKQQNEWKEDNKKLKEEH
jgi:hypothetical protein